VRHQFVINETYLESHSVTSGTGKDSLKDPFEMSVWQLKECIWKDWRDEWDQRPASALFIRLIHFGRMLDDKQHLKDCKLNHDTPNVVHMTIRPAETGDDEMTQRSAKIGFGSRQRDDQRTPRCRCVILWGFSGNGGYQKDRGRYSCRNFRSMGRVVGNCRWEMSKFTNQHWKMFPTIAGLNSCFVVCIYVLSAAMLSFYSFAFLLFLAHGVCVNYLFLLPRTHGNLFFASYRNTLFPVFSMLPAFLGAFHLHPFYYHHVWFLGNSCGIHYQEL